MYVSIHLNRPTQVQYKCMDEASGHIWGRCCSIKKYAMSEVDLSITDLLITTCKVKQGSNHGVQCYEMIIMLRINGLCVSSNLQ